MTDDFDTDTPDTPEVAELWSKRVAELSAWHRAVAEHEPGWRPWMDKDKT